MDKVKLLGLPKEVRPRFNEECRNALLDSRDEINRTLSPNRAALLLRQRLLGGVQVRLSFTMTPDPLTGSALFNEDDLFMLHDAAWNHLVGWQVQENAQRMKVKLDAPVEEGEDALESLRDNCYGEIITYRAKEGGVVFKFVGDASMAELMLTAEQYAEKKQRAAMRETRANAIIRKMKARGASEDTSVFEALKYLPKLNVV